MACMTDMLASVPWCLKRMDNYEKQCQNSEVLKSFSFLQVCQVRESMPLFKSCIGLLSTFSGPSTVFGAGKQQCTNQTKIPILADVMRPHSGREVSQAEENAYSKHHHLVTNSVSGCPASVWDWDFGPIPIPLHPSL